MMEVGPWRVDGKGGLKRVEGGWEEYTTMVYSAFSLGTVNRRISNTPIVDQPAGTGFSYTASNKYLHELDQVLTAHSFPLYA